MVILNRIKMLDMAFELGSDTQAVNRQVDRAFELGTNHKGLLLPPPPVSAATAGTSSSSLG
jgi:hypothetical protein